jgi:dTMP kinase
MSRTARFIVLEGIDGSGSTTQGEMLAARLRKARVQCQFTHEPTAGPAGSLIRLALARRLRGLSASLHKDDSGHERVSDELDSRFLALLFAADRMDHVATEIEPNLKADRHVICDRYVLSSLAYQGVDQDLQWLLAINKYARRPDVTILLDLPVEHARVRMRHARWTRDLFETVERQREVAERYRQFLPAYQEMFGRTEIVDAARSPAVIADEVWSICSDVLSSVPKLATDMPSLFSPSGEKR